MSDSDSEYSDSEYSDTLSIDTAVNNLTDDMNTYFVWRDATIQRLDVMAGMIDELQIRAGALETDRDSLRGRIHLLEHRRGFEPGAGGGKRRKRTRGKKRTKKRRKSKGRKRRKSRRKKRGKKKTKKRRRKRRKKKTKRRR